MTDKEILESGKDERLSCKNAEDWLEEFDLIKKTPKSNKSKGVLFTLVKDNSYWFIGSKNKMIADFILGKNKEIEDLGGEIWLEVYHCTERYSSINIPDLKRTINDLTPEKKQKMLSILSTLVESKCGFFDPESSFV